MKFYKLEQIGASENYAVTTKIAKDSSQNRYHDQIDVKVYFEYAEASAFMSGACGPSPRDGFVEGDWYSEKKAEPPKTDDTAILDWMQRWCGNPVSIVSVGGGPGGWSVSAYIGRECWGNGKTLREAVIQAILGTGPDKPDGEAWTAAKEKVRKLGHDPLCQVHDGRSCDCYKQHMEG